MSKIWLGVEKYAEDRAKVVSYHYNPIDLPDEIRNNGLEVDTLLEIPQCPVGKIGEVFINPATLNMWVEYTDRPLNDDERIAQLEANQKITSDALAEYLLGGTV